MTQESSLVFLLDVDNTLLDNDRFKADIDVRARSILGKEVTERFWQIYEQVRQELDYVDYPEASRRLAAEKESPSLSDELMSLLYSMQLDAYVYPGVFPVLSYLRKLGTPVILSDGDQVFQRWKIEHSGLARAVENHVLIYVHKEQHLDAVFSRYPASHYVMVDDKPRILSALESMGPATFTTILVLQGKYARMADYPTKPDWVVPHIADVRNFSLADFLGSATQTRA